MVCPMNNDNSHHYSLRKRPLGKTKHRKSEKGLWLFLAFVGNSLSTIIRPIALEPKGHKFSCEKAILLKLIGL